MGCKPSSCLCFDCVEVEPISPSDKFRVFAERKLDKMMHKRVALPTKRAPQSRPRQHKNRGMGKRSVSCGSLYYPSRMCALMTRPHSPSNNSCSSGPSISSQHLYPKCQLRYQAEVHPAPKVRNLECIELQNLSTPQMNIPSIPSWTSEIVTWCRVQSSANMTLGSASAQQELVTSFMSKPRLKSSTSSEQDSSAGSQVEPDYVTSSSFSHSEDESSDSSWHECPETSSRF